MQHRWPSFRILSRADIPNGFMQQDIDMFGSCRDHFPINTHPVTRGINPRALRSHSLPIDLHAPARYQFLGMPPRSNSRVSQETRQALAPSLTLLFIPCLLCHSNLSPTIHTS